MKDKHKNEPFTFSIDGKSIADFLGECGHKIVRHLNQDQIETTYLKKADGSSICAGYFLSKMAKKGTEGGWEAYTVRGKATDDFDLSVVTKKCGPVDYLKSEGMTDHLKYCNFSDFIMFSAMNIGLKQPCTINDGQCVYCMKYKGHSEIPASLDVINNST